MNFDPLSWGSAVERYLGTWGRRLFKFTLFAVLVATICAALTVPLWFFGYYIWPFFVWLFDGTDTGITLDNIEAIILVLAASLTIFVLTMAVLVWILAGSSRKVKKPQHVLDALAEHRSDGISVLNTFPPNIASMTQPQKDQYVTNTWEPGWKAWSNNVVDFLEQNFTKAESLSFARLGVITEHRFSSALNPQHGHYLMQLSKQLSILEDLIQRYQERM